MTMNDLTGAVGVGLLLVAYFLSVFRIITPNSRLYLVLNVLGAAIACYASYLIHYYPFVILEGTWALVSAVALIRKLMKGHSE